MWQYQSACFSLVNKLHTVHVTLNHNTALLHMSFTHTNVPAVHFHGHPEILQDIILHAQLARRFWSLVLLVKALRLKLCSKTAYLLSQARSRQNSGTFQGISWTPLPYSPPIPGSAQCVHPELRGFPLWYCNRQVKDGGGSEEGLILGYGKPELNKIIQHT